MKQPRTSRRGRTKSETRRLRARLRPEDNCVVCNPRLTMRESTANQRQLDAARDREKECAHARTIFMTGTLGTYELCETCGTRIEPRPLGEWLDARGRM